MVRFILGLALVSSVQNAARAAAPALMPLPVSVQTRGGSLTIENTFNISTSGCADPRIPPAAGRLIARVARQTGIPMMGQPATKLTVECAARGADYPVLGEDESYTLEIAAAGSVLKAATGTGALRGMETFAQAIAPGASGFEIAAMTIEDRPRFPWRGLMMDASRHWMPVEVVERNLDAMAAVKLNVFHWHLSDDQGFRVESKVSPKLQQMGSDGHYYTQDQLREVIEYARQRGIRVIPEFDIPGHTQAWFPGYPDLASTPMQYTIGRTWGIYYPVMDPTLESTYQFLEGFIGEMAAIFPDPYFHIGGDEVNPKEWNGNARIMAFAKDHNLSGPEGLQAYFNQRVSKILDKTSKIMIGWDEVLNPALPAATMIQSWRGNQALADAAKQGHRGILSWGYYLDHLSPASYHYGIDPLGGPAAQLPTDAAARILGGEACMWAEYVNAETVDSRIWPRMAAIAERLWSPRETADVESMYARMSAVSRSLEWTGVQHRANYQPMLDRLSGGRPAEALLVLADVSEAQGLGPRARARQYTSLVPLNRLVDAARPESEVVRTMEAAAGRLEAADAAYLREQFTRWVENDARFQALAAGNAMLAEALPLSKDLAGLGRAGLRLLDALGKKERLPADWLTSESAELTRLMAPQAEVVLAAYRPVAALLVAAGGQAPRAPARRR
jgi:hexosaminidase